MKYFFCDLLLSVLIVVAPTVGADLASGAPEMAGELADSSEQPGNTKSGRGSGGTTDPHRHPSNAETRLESLIEEGIEEGMKIDELERRKRYERYLPPKGEVKSEGQWSLECTSDRAPSEMVHPEARSC